MTFTATELRNAVDAATSHLKAELRAANKENGELTERVNMLMYAFKGLCGEKLNLRVELSCAELLQAQDAYEYLNFAINHAARRLAHEALHRFEEVHKLHEELARCKAALHPSAFYTFERDLRT